MNENARDNIEKILANMTTLPGVYRMLGKDGELLYVGKAKNLKKPRVELLCKNHRTSQNSGLGGTYL